MVFNSVYEITDNLCTVRKTREWCWFDGDIINPKWNQVVETGTPTFLMSTVSGGGMEIVTGTTSGAAGRIEYADAANHFDDDGMIGLSVYGYTTASSHVGNIGFISDPSASLGDDRVEWIMSTGLSNFRYITEDVSSTFTCSCTARDTSFHNFKIEMLPCCSEGTIDGGCVCVTHSCNLPNVPLQPMYRFRNLSTTTGTLSLRYMEAFNT